MLRIVTLNTWKGGGDYPARLEAMGAGLARLDPDVVALQECLLAPAAGLDTAAALAARLGLHHALLPMRRKVRRVGERRLDCWSGLALLSRWPILERSDPTLPPLAGDDVRRALLARLDCPGGPITAACLHLSWPPGAGGTRRKQLEAVLAAPLWSAPARLRLLAGDFNAAPDSPELRALGSGVHGWRARSCWDAAKAPPAATFDPANPLTAPLERPAALDHIYALYRPEAAAPEFGAVRVVLDHPDPRGTWPSDHFSVFAGIAPRGPGDKQGSPGALSSTHGTTRSGVDR